MQYENSFLVEFYVDLVTKGTVTGPSIYSDLADHLSRPVIAFTREFDFQILLFPLRKYFGTTIGECSKRFEIRTSANILC